MRSWANELFSLSLSFSICKRACRKAVFRYASRALGVVPAHSQPCEVASVLVIPSSRGGVTVCKTERHGNHTYLRRAPITSSLASPASSRRGSSGDSAGTAGTAGTARRQLNGSSRRRPGMRVGAGAQRTASCRLPGARRPRPQMAGGAGRTEHHRPRPRPRPAGSAG